MSRVDMKELCKLERGAHVGGVMTVVAPGRQFDVFSTDFPSQPRSVSA